MPPVHGRRVVGDDAYDKAVREEVGGVHTFGVRVRGAIPDNGPTNAAKRVTEHGPLVVAGAQFQDEKGTVGDAIAIESLRKILTENPTFFDSLFEAELARPEGARPEALPIFYEVERGIKGAGRADVLDEIRQLLNEKRPAAAAQADLNKARIELAARQQERMADNDRLGDAALSPNTATQLRGVAEELGLTIDQNEGAVVGDVPAKGSKKRK